MLVLLQGKPLKRTHILRVVVKVVFVMQINISVSNFDNILLLKAKNDIHYLFYFMQGMFCWNIVTRVTFDSLYMWPHLSVVSCLCYFRALWLIFLPIPKLVLRTFTLISEVFGYFEKIYMYYIHNKLRKAIFRKNTYYWFFSLLWQLKL